MNSTVRYLSSSDVKKCLSMLQAIEAIREALRLLSGEEVVVSPFLHLVIPEQQNTELVKPVYIPSVVKSLENTAQEILAAQMILINSLR